MTVYTIHVIPSHVLLILSVTLYSAVMLDSPKSFVYKSSISFVKQKDPRNRLIIQLWGKWC